MSQYIQHLYQRAGFGLCPSEWQRLRNTSVTQAVEELFRAATAAAPLEVVAFEEVAETVMQDRRKASKLLTQQYTLEWLDRMADLESSALLERLTLFWHDHFACRSVFGHLAIQQLAALRTHALGSFRDLCLAIARDPAMIRYLNNQQNKKDSPNENFARELLELFTIGPGYYTEQDIKEAARAFTGWSSTYKGKFRFRAAQHDYGDKTFMGQTDRFNGEDIINIVLDDPAAARFLVRKFWNYYVSAPPDEQRINELSRAYYESNYNTEQLLRSIFVADWFYTPEVQAGQIKSPVVLAVNLRRQLNIRFDQPQAQLRLLRALGQNLFDPPNVAGWPGGRAWIDNATLMLRLSLGAGLLSKKEIDLRFRDQPELEIMSDPRTRKLEAVVDLRPLQNLIRGEELAEDFQLLSEYLLASSARITTEELAKLVDDTKGEERLRRMLLVIFSSPEYQVA
jgi:uncharacterized protein (DUF1800 family)